MDDLNFRERIREALGEVRPPVELVERMVRCAGAIVRGRESEWELARMGEAQADRVLLAKAVVGRRLLNREVPLNSDPESMVARLRCSEKFLSVSDNTAAVLLEKLEDGSLLKLLSE